MSSATAMAATGSSQSRSSPRKDPFPHQDQRQPDHHARRRVDIGAQMPGISLERDGVRLLARP